MFTGLIEEKGKIIRLTPQARGVRLTVDAPMISAGVNIGDSVAVNGTCLTVVKISPPSLEFDAVEETVERSTIRRLKPGSPVNLERSLRVGDRMGGHMVQGHVDGIGTIEDIRSIGGETRFRISAQPEVMKYIVEKGSITVDGISLTVADLGPNWFAVAVIPHSLSATTLADASMGATVNLETDIIGKYVYKFVKNSATDSDQRLLDKLSAGGYLE